MNNVIHPCLWFDGKAKEAATFYCSVFNHAAITSDSPIVVTFEAAGQKFICLNGGPMFTPNPSVSFFVICETPQEINETWNKLQDGGTVLMPLDKYAWSEQYGWVQDKYGISWQLSYGKLQDVGQKFSPSLLFTGAQHGRAEEAIQFYTSIFDNAAITGILKYGADEPDQEGMVKHAQFTLRQSVFMVADSSYAHDFNFNEAISFVVNCQTQDEIDYYWNRLTEGGEESMCGWLKDKFGVSWQIIPAILEKLMGDPERSQRVVQAFLQMKKFNIEKLMQA